MSTTSRLRLDDRIGANRVLVIAIGAFGFICAAFTIAIAVIAYQQGIL